MFARSLVIVSCVAACGLAPSAASAQSGDFAKSHVIKTSKGNQLVVPITVRYRLDGDEAALRRSSLTARLGVTARLPGGARVRASARRVLPASQRLRVTQQPFFSVRATRALRRALARGQRVRLAVTASLQGDSNADGRVDLRSSDTSRFTLSAPTRARSPRPTAHRRGTNPCASLRLPAGTCFNQPGVSWNAGWLWDSLAIRLACTSQFPYNTGVVTVATDSRRYSEALTLPTSPRGSSVITLVNENLRGNPTDYTPFVACSSQPPAAG